MERFYRSWHKSGLKYFTVQCEETDLWIAVDSYAYGMESAVLKFVSELRQTIKTYAVKAPDFLTSLEPIEVSEDSPEIIFAMSQAAKLAGVGPMAAIAGAIADRVGNFLSAKFACSQVIVENGGDIYIKNLENVFVSIYAGSSPLSCKIGLIIPPGEWGVCTSSGTVGHSLSFGKADAVTVVSKNATIADAFATAYCNMVKVKDDVEMLLQSAIREHVKTVVVILEDKLGIVGEHELVLFGEGERYNNEGDRENNSEKDSFN